jgi:hypothetical protein
LPQLPLLLLLLLQLLLMPLHHMSCQVLFKVSI